MLLVCVCLALAAAVWCAPAPISSNSDIVWRHVNASASATFRSPNGLLRFPYQVPAGPYDQLWDWDSVHEGVGMLPFGSAPYFAGSMMNFLDWVRLHRPPRVPIALNLAVAPSPPPTFPPSSRSVCMSECCVCGGAAPSPHLLGVCGVCGVCVHRRPTRRTAACPGV